MMVAHLGRDQLATNVLVWGVYITLLLFFFGMQNVISGMVAQHLGAKDIKGVRLIVAQGFILTLFFTIPMTTVMWFVPKILYLTGKNLTNIKLAVPYCKVLALGILPINVLVVIEQFLIGIGVTRPVLFVSLLKVPVEILFIYAFVFGKWGVPNLGLAGVGYGIFISTVIAVLGVSGYAAFSRKCRRYRLFRDFYKFNIDYFSKLIRVGFPLGLMYGSELALFATAAFMMGIFGNDSLAAYQIAYQCFVFALTIIFGISQGTTVRIGYEAGSGNRKSLISIFFANIIICIVFMLLMGILYSNFPDRIIAFGVDVFAKENLELVKQATIFLFLAAICQLLDCFRMIGVGALRGLNDPKAALYISIISFWLVAFPAIYTFAFVLNFRGVGIWLGLLSGIFIGGMILLARFRYLVRSLNLSLIFAR
jgi:MATE family multidrug resistance protein